MTPQVSDIDETVRRNVRALRLANDMTQGELAAAVDLSRASISNIEAGNQCVGVALLVDLAAALGVTPAALLSGEGGASDAAVLARARVAERHARKCEIRAVEAEAREAKARAELLAERALRLRAESALDDLGEVS